MSRRIAISRRSFTGLAALGALPARAETSGVVALDWTLVQTLLALGVRPLAASRNDFYRSFVIEPPLPDSVREIGLRAEPNLELLQELRPQLILLCPEFGDLTALLAEIAPVEQVPIYDPAVTSFYASALRATRQMASRLDLAEVGEAYIRQVEDVLAQARVVAAAYRGAQFCLFSLVGPRRVRLYVGGSLLDGVLAEIGLANIAPRSSSANAWGFADVGTDVLAEHPDATFVHVGPLRPGLLASPIMKALPFSRNRSLLQVPACWMFGGLPSAARFARTLSDALRQAGHER